MSVPFAYLGVVIIWSTTPLAIKWSGEEVGFLFGVASRMVLGLVLSMALLMIWRRVLPLHGAAIRVYFAVGIPLYLAMSCVYWGAQYIPSGLISVIFGLTPLVTGMMAIYWLQEKSFTPFRLIGMALGVSGLGVIFNNSIVIGPHAHWGIFGVLGAVFFHSLGTVWVKKVGATLPAFTSNSGGLVVAVILYSLTWLVFDRGIPTSIAAHTALSIVYLGVFGSVLGAVLFYYALKHVDTGKMAMLTLITPVTALLLGRLFNGEVLEPVTIAGTALVLSGLIFYQWAEPILRSVLNRKLKATQQE